MIIALDNQDGIYDVAISSRVRSFVDRTES